MAQQTRPVFFNRAGQIALALLLVIYFVLAAVYTLVTPPLESPDAYYHYGVIQYFSENLELPPRENPEDHPWTHAVFHAPLYYMLSGLLILPIDTTDFPELYPRNPHARIGLPHSLNNFNFVSIMAEPWQGSYLAVYVVRAFSILWGAVSVAAVFWLGRLLAPQKLAVAIVAAVFVVAMPQFLYMSAVINNDNMVVALGLVTLVLLVYILKYDYSTRLIWIMAFVMAAASLSKANALPLYPTVALGFLYLKWRDQLSWGVMFRWGAIIMGVWAVMSGWWFLDMWISYGDPTGTTPLAMAAGGASGVPTGLDALWDEFIGVYYSFWGLFGWFNIIAPQIFYDFMTIMLAIAAVGLVFALIRNRPSRNESVIIALLVFHAALVFAGWWRFRGMVSAAQGRMLFSILGALAVGVGYGLTVYRPRWTRIMPAVLLAGMLYAAVNFPLTLLAPSYQLPTELNEIPPGVNQVDVRYGPVVLRGYEINPTPVNYWQYRVPEDREFVEITLYWQPLERTEKPLSMFVQVYAPDANFEPIEVGKVDSYPGEGMMRTDTWETGIIYADKYNLELYGDFDLTPFEPRFVVGLRDNEEDTYIDATTREGDPIEAVVPRGGSVYSTEVDCAALNETEEIAFADLVRLTGFALPEGFITQAGGTLDLRLQWDITGITPDDYAVFVQLIDPDDPGALWGTGDSVPRQDWYPTSRWVPDVCFNDQYFVQVSEDVPPGEYRLLVGLYNQETGTRLNAQLVSSEDSESLLGGGYLLPQPIQVEQSVVSGD